MTTTTVLETTTTHQPRDHAAPCRGCHKPTWSPHAVCYRCHQGHVQVHHQHLVLSSLCDLCADDPAAAVWPERVTA